MSKSFDIVMAGLISGIVALTTTFLGVAGSVIGAVLGAILYQIISIFVKEPLENATVRRVEREIVYLIPLVLIAVFLLIFIIALLHSYSLYYPDFLEFFRQLEEITNNNLVRFMGIGLIVMGIYPVFQSNSIKKEYGLTILILGVLLLIRGLLDLSPEFFYLYTKMFGFFDVIATIVVFLALATIIIKILMESISLYKGRNDDIAVDEYTSNKITKTKDSIKNDPRFNSKMKNTLDNHTNYDNKNNDIHKDISRSRSETQTINDSRDINNMADNVVSRKKSDNGENISIGEADDFSTTDNTIDNENFTNEKIASKKPFNNKTIKSNKTSTMPKNRKFFKR